MLVATACGEAASGDEAPADVPEAASETADGGDGGDAAEDDPQGERDVIRFAFAPDAVWSYMRDTGELAEWEEANNIRVVTSESWEVFDYFAGGHGDVAIVGTAELPLLEEQMDTKLVAFGAYQHQNVPLMHRARDNFDTLDDVPEDETICANSTVGDTIVWSVIADQLHDIDYRVGQGDFNIVLQDHFAMPALVEDGDCAVAAAIPQAAAGPLRTGDLEMMYDGRAPWRIYQEDICECDHKGVMSKLFVSTQEWYDAHPDQVAAFLALWERGLRLWEENRDEIIGLYVDHFVVETEEDIDFMTNFVSGDNNWFVETVYMDEAWIEEEQRFYDHMIDSGWMSESAEIPSFEAVPPPSE
jgi:ABC-type nitrate/sulfonate/bicarbonate transport system substrate-binding protein